MGHLNIPSYSEVLDRSLLHHHTLISMDMVIHFLLCLGVYYLLVPTAEANINAVSNTTSTLADCTNNDCCSGTLCQSRRFDCIPIQTECCSYCLGEDDLQDRRINRRWRRRWRKRANKRWRRRRRMRRR